MGHYPTLILFLLPMIVTLLLTIPVAIYSYKNAGNPINGRKYTANYWGKIVRLALEDPETRAAIFDAMQVEAQKRKGN